MSWIVVTTYNTIDVDVQLLKMNLRYNDLQFGVITDHQ